MIVSFLIGTETQDFIVATGMGDERPSIVEATGVGTLDRKDLDEVAILGEGALGILSWAPDNVFPWDAKKDRGWLFKDKGRPMTPLFHLIVDISLAPDDS